MTSAHVDDTAAWRGAPLRAAAGAISETLWALSPWVPTDEPHAVDQVGPDYISAAFAAVAPGARALSVTDQGGHSGTTSRRRFAITWNSVGRQAGLPTSVFAKATSPSPKNRTMVAALGLARNEIAFYQTARPGLPDHLAPQAYHSYVTRGARHLLLTEDVVSNGGTAYSLADDADPAHAFAMMETLALLHAHFWETPRFATDLSWVKPESQRPGFFLLLWQFRSVRGKLLKASGVELPSAVRDMADFVNRHDRELHRQWERGPQTLLHGDCHMGNTFRLVDGRAGLLDWQVVHRGPGMREVAYFLTHSTPTAVRREYERDLIAHYLQALTDCGIADAPNSSQAWDLYRFFVFDAWDSSAITVVWPGLQDRSNVQAGFARANATVADLDVVGVLREVLGLE